jgi:hypothetical protein
MRDGHVAELKEARAKPDTAEPHKVPSSPGKGDPVAPHWHSASTERRSEWHSIVQRHTEKRNKLDKAQAADRDRTRTLTKGGSKMQETHEQEHLRLNEAEHGELSALAGKIEHDGEVSAHRARRQNEERTALTEKHRSEAR